LTPPIISDKIYLKGGKLMAKFLIPTLIAIILIFIFPPVGILGTVALLGYIAIPKILNAFKSFLFELIDKIKE